MSHNISCVVVVALFVEGYNNECLGPSRLLPKQGHVKTEKTESVHSMQQPERPPELQGLQTAASRRLGLLEL